jgi:hypothetical protein
MFTLKQMLLIISPVVLLFTTCFVFNKLTVLLGRERGYFAGFLFYWVFWCFFLPWWILGSNGLTQAFHLAINPFGRPVWIGIALLVAPLLLGYGYAFPRAIKNATIKLVILSALLAIINATLEELLWRGTFISAFPENWFFGLLYPAIGFAVWHFAPQSIFPNKSPGGNLSLVIVAGIVGLMWGRVAWQSGSILLGDFSHILFDFSGLGGRIYLGKSETENGH